MEMWRRIGLACAVAWLVAGNVAAQPSSSVPAAGCTYPTALDVFSTYLPGDRLINTEVNRLQCTVNALQERLGTDGGGPGGGPGSGIGPVVCGSLALQAGERKLWSLTAPSTLAGTEAIFASVIDTTVPARVTMDGVQSRTGTTVSGWAFNRDAASSRTVTVCAHILAP